MNTLHKYRNGKPIRIGDTVAISYYNCYITGIVSDKTNDRTVWYHPLGFSSDEFQWYITSNFSQRIIKITRDHLTREEQESYDELYKRLNYESTTDNT